MKKQGKWYLTVCAEFCAAHSLRHYQGKCENQHGHNFGVKIQVMGNRLSPDTEIVLDFKTLKTLLAKSLSALDHKNLNEVEYFKARNPSSENLACFIYKDLQKKLEIFPVELKKVTVSEKPGQSATYFES